MQVTNGRVTGGLRGASALKESTKSYAKAKDIIKLGQNHRLIFKLNKDEEGNYVNDIVAAFMWGRKLDNDIFKRSFFPLRNCEMGSNNKPIDNSGLAAWQRISRCIFDTQAKLEKEDAANEAERVAEKTGEPIDKTDLAEKCKKIDIAYYGDPDATPQVYATKQVAIGRMDMLIAGECWAIPIKEDGSPDWKGSGIISIDLGSNKKREQLFSLLDNADYCRVGDGYLEVGYDYRGTSRVEAGRNAAYQGIAQSLSLAVKFPTEWEANKDKLNRLADTGEDIKSKNFQMSADISANDIITKLKHWLSTKKLILPSIDVTADNTKYCVEDLLESGLVDGMKIQAELIELANKVRAEKGEGTADKDALDGSDAEQLMSAETIKQIAGSNIDVAVADGNDIL